TGFGPYGLFLAREDGLDPVALPGQLVPLPCQGFNCQRWMTDIEGFTAALNDSGQVAFSTTIAGTGVDSSNDEVVLLADDNGLQVVMRAGDAPPDTFGAVYSSWWLSVMHLNSAGEVAVATRLDSQATEGVHWSI